MEINRTLLIAAKGMAPYRIRFYSEAAKALRPAGWRVVLAVAESRPRDHPWSDPGAEGDGLHISAVGGSFWPRLRRSALGSRLFPDRVALPSLQLLGLLSRENPDVVWTHEYSPFCVAAAGWAKLHGKPGLLSTELGDHPPPYACTARQLARQNRLSGIYSAVIAHTLEATRRTRPVGAPVMFAPHAISTEEYHPLAGRVPGKFRFLFTGALNSRKGIDRLIQAARVLDTEGHVFELRVLGTGELRAWLAEQPDEWLSVGGFVEGEALRSEYRNADAYVLPTRGDTYAVTVHEAAASGLPLIVGSTAGAVETLVHEGVSGYAIDADDVEDIAAKMRMLLDDVGNARRMGARARLLAEQYDVGKLGRAAADFIEDLWARR